MLKHTETPNVSSEAIKLAIEMHEHDQAQTQQKQSVIAALGEMQVPPEYLERATAEIKKRDEQRRWQVFGRCLAGACVLGAVIGYSYQKVAHHSKAAPPAPIASAPATQQPEVQVTKPSPAIPSIAPVATPVPAKKPVAAAAKPVPVEQTAVPAAKPLPVEHAAAQTGKSPQVDHANVASPPAEQTVAQTVKPMPIEKPVAQTPKPSPFNLEFTVDPQNHWTSGTNGPTQATLTFQKDAKGVGYARLSVEKYNLSSNGRFWANMFTIDGGRILTGYHIIKFRARSSGLPRLGLELSQNDVEKWHPDPLILTSDWLPYELHMDQFWHIKQEPNGSWVTLDHSDPDRISTVVFYVGDGTSDASVSGHVDVEDVTFE